MGLAGRHFEWLLSLNISYEAVQALANDVAAIYDANPSEAEALEFCSRPTVFSTRDIYEDDEPVTVRSNQ
jgi:hypothetical protein